MFLRKLTLPWHHARAKKLILRVPYFLIFTSFFQATSISLFLGCHERQIRLLPGDDSAACATLDSSYLKQKSRRGFRAPRRLLESNFYFLIIPSRGNRVSARRSPPSWRAPDRPGR